MHKTLGAYLKSQRINKGLNRQQLAVLLGYTKLKKGVRRIEKAENGTAVPTGLLEKISSALSLDPDLIADAIEKDRKAFEVWVNEPVRPELIIRCVAAFYLRHEIPDHICSDKEVIKYALSVSRKYKLKACLILNRRWTCWFDGNEGYTACETTFGKKISHPTMNLRLDRLGLSLDSNETINIEGALSNYNH